MRSSVAGGVVQRVAVWVSGWCEAGAIGCAELLHNFEYRLKPSAQTSLASAFNQHSKPAVSLHIFFAFFTSNLLMPFDDGLWREILLESIL